MIIERDDELERLDGLLSVATTDGGRIVTVQGPLGVGKTELLLRLVRRASPRVRTLGAVCSHLETHLTLGVLGQLFHPAALRGMLPSGFSGRIGPAAAAALFGPHRAECPPDPDIVPVLGTALLELAAGQPLVIVVDDVHHSDALSAQCLSYAARRVSRYPVLIVFGERVRPVGQPVFSHESATNQNWHHLALGPLSAAGIERFAALAADRGYPGAAEPARRCGGNPAILHALLDDARDALGAAPAPDGPEPQVGGQALRRVLARLDPTERRITEALAVLGREAPFPLLGQLAELDEAVVATTLRTLGDAGLLTDEWFSDPILADTVLAELDAARLGGLHRAAARLQYSSGGGAMVVARHLLTAWVDADGRSTSSPPWSSTVFHQAGILVASGRSDLSLVRRYLHAAQATATDENQRAAVTVALAQAEWRANPLLAMRHLPALAAAIRAGRLGARASHPPLNWMLWFGQVDEALDLMREAGGPPGTTPWTPDSIALWLAWLYPDRLLPQRDSGAEPVGPRPAATALALDPMRHATHLLRVAVSGGADDDLVAEAEKILHGPAIRERTLQSVVALAALVFGERTALAADWCDALRAEPVAAFTTRQAILTAVRAEIALRCGDLHAAETFATEALELLPPASWGVLVGLPVSTLIQARLGAGRLDDAAAALRTPVPDALLSSVIGLLYLRARGLYFQHTDRHSAALLDFELCGDMLRRWDFDHPALVPWRSDAAVSHLALGRFDEAHRLAAEQLTLTPTTQPRIYGMSLRALGAANPARSRPALLGEAVAAMRSSHDRMELAWTLASLAEAHRSTGDWQEAAVVAAEAAELADRCSGTLRPGRPAPRSGTVLRNHATGPRSLSPAERRVVEVAATGLTNREIADQLFITVSTVEQHLTRSYRKLGVTRRSDLGAALEARADSA